MGREIERKFLLADDSWRPGEPGIELRQGYLSLDPRRTVRVRVRDQAGFVTIKGETRGIARLEFEYPIPIAEACQMLDELCIGSIIEKRRYRRRGPDGLIWEVDEFDGLNLGLLIAEVELDREDRSIELPAWIGKEVSSDPRYFNAALASAPFSSWQPSERHS